MEATAQQLWCPVTTGSALVFWIRTWPARRPRECSPPCPPHTRGRAATSRKQDRKGWMAQGVAWAGRSEASPAPRRAHPHKEEPQRWSSLQHFGEQLGVRMSTQQARATWRQAGCATHAQRARSDKTSSTEQEPREASGMTEYRAAPQNPNAV